MHGVTQRETAISRSEYNKAIGRYRLGENIAYHLQFIFYLALYDKFDMTARQMMHLGKKIVERREVWQNDADNSITSQSMAVWSKKKKIDVIGWVKSVPMSQKLYLADVKKGRAVLGADQNIEYALAATMFLTLPILKETYRFSNVKVKEFMKWVAYYIDSYWRKQPGCKDHFLSDEIIRQTFIEDEHWDIVTGKKVEKC